MLTSDDLLTPDWILEVTLANSVLRTTIHGADQLLPEGVVPKGALVAVSGAPDESSYVYVIQIGKDAIAVLYPLDGGASFEKAGAALRFPSDASGFLTPIDGRIRVVESPEPVPADKWWELLAGRDDPREGSTILNSSVNPLSSGNGQGAQQPSDAKSNTPHEAARTTERPAQ